MGTPTTKGVDVRLPVVATVPLTLRIACVTGAVDPAPPLVAHTRAAAPTGP